MLPPAPFRDTIQPDQIVDDIPGPFGRPSIRLLFSARAARFGFSRAGFALNAYDRLWLGIANGIPVG